MAMLHDLIDTGFLISEILQISEEIMNVSLTAALWQRMERGQTRMDFPDGPFAVQSKHRSHCPWGVRLGVYSEASDTRALSDWHRKRDGTDTDTDHARFRSYYTQVLIKKLLIWPGIRTYSGSLWRLGAGIYFLHIITNKNDMRIFQCQILFPTWTYYIRIPPPVDFLSQKDKTWK